MEKVGRTFLSVPLISTDRNVRPTIVGAIVSLYLLVLAGCPSSTQPLPSAPTDPAAPSPSVALHVVVVNDPPLAEAINRLRGEWAERSRGSLTATSQPWSEVAAAKTIEADILIFPTRYLGELCTRELLRPVRNNVLEAKSFNAEDVFPLVRRELITWGGQVMALPLGIDLPVMCYRSDLFGQKIASQYGSKYLRPSETWDDYLDFIRSDEEWAKKNPTSARVIAAWEPLDRWSAVLLLARAASWCALHDEQAGILFDPRSMSPRITEPIFFRALTELQQTNSYFDPNYVPSDELDRKLGDPRASSRRLATAKAQMMAFGLPPAGHREILAKGNRVAHGFGDVNWKMLPGSTETYNSSTRQWEKQPGIHRVPLLGVGDRLAAVTTSSRNAATAFKLLAWLAEPETSTQLARAGDGTMPVRQSLASSPSWYDPKLNASERSDLGKALEQSLTSQECLIIPRIPGIDDYLAALDEAVKDAVAGKIEPQAALEQAADKWEQITDCLGRDAQRAAYLKHLGITEP